MARFCLLLLLLLTLLPLAGTLAQSEPPPQFALALASLGSRLNRSITLDDLDAWNYQQNLYTDTAFGCPYVVGESRPNGISAFTFTFGYQGQTYDYRVAVDGSLTFACDASLPQGPQPTAMPTNCPVGYVGYLPPRLAVGGSGRIGSGGTANRLRDQPSINATQIGLIQPGSTVSVLEGPTCEDQSKIIWWRVDDNGVVGWTAEGTLPDNYFLSPVSATLPAERDLISAANAETLTPLTSIALAGVSSVSLAPDEKLIALGGLSGLAVYDLANLSLITRLGDISAPVTAVAFSPDGRYLAYGTQAGSVIVYDTLTSTRTPLAQVTNSRINSLTFNADAANSVLIYGSGSPTSTPGAVSRWEALDLPEGDSLINMPTSASVRNVAFSPDDTLFAWLDTSLHVIDADGAAVGTFALERPGNGGMAWRSAETGSASTHQIAFTDGARVRLINLDTRVEQTYADDPDFAPGALAFNRDGSLLAVMNVPSNTVTASRVNIFDVETSDLVASTPMQASSALLFSPDGTLLVIASADEVVFLGVDNSQVAVG